MGGAFGDLFKASTESGIPLIEDVVPFPHKTVVFCLFFPSIMVLVALIVAIFCLIREVLWCRKEYKEVTRLKKKEQVLIQEVYIKQQKMLDDEAGIFNPEALVQNRENAIDYIMMEERGKEFDRKQKRVKLPGKKKVKKREAPVLNKDKSYAQVDPSLISGYSSYISGNSYPDYSGYSGYSRGSTASGYSDASGYSNGGSYSSASGYSNPSGYSSSASGYSDASGYSSSASGYSNPSGYSSSASGYSNPSGYSSSSASGYSNPSGYSSSASGYSNASGSDASGYSSASKTKGSKSKRSKASQSTVSKPSAISYSSASGYSDSSGYGSSEVEGDEGRGTGNSPLLKGSDSDGSMMSDASSTGSKSKRSKKSSRSKASKANRK